MKFITNNEHYRKLVIFCVCPDSAHQAKREQLEGHIQFDKKFPYHGAHGRVTCDMIKVEHLIWNKRPIKLQSKQLPKIAATATFQRLMAQALTRVTRKYGNLVMCYADDVVKATPILEDHMDRLDDVFGFMKRAGLKSKPSKCEILRDSIKYLGRMVDRHGVRPDPEAVEAVLTWKAPRTNTQLMSFLGVASYYREFMKGYADKVYLKQFYKFLMQYTYYPETA